MEVIQQAISCCPCRARDWKIFFDPTVITMGAFPGFGVHVLLDQKSLKKLNGAHFEPQVQRPANTALCGGFPLPGVRLTAG